VRKRKETSDPYGDLPLSKIEGSPLVKGSMVGDSLRGEYSARSGKRENTWRTNSISKNFGIQTYIECRINVY
jgi:hypothetical protein